MHVLLEHLFEGREEGADAVEAVESFDAVVLRQVVGEVDRVRVTDEGGVILVAEDGEGAFGPNELEAFFVHLEVLDELLAEDQKRPGADAVLVAFEELLGRGLSAGPVGLLEDQHLLACPLELYSGREAIVACTYDDYVKFGHRFVPFESAMAGTEMRGSGVESKGSV